jgi:hypothetical protein
MIQLLILWVTGIVMSYFVFNVLGDSESELSFEELIMFNLLILIFSWIILIPFLIVLLYDYIKGRKTR